jgi:hypothetical protein
MLRKKIAIAFGLLDDEVVVALRERLVAGVTGVVEQCLP